MTCDMAEVAIQNVSCLSDLGPHAKNGLGWIWKKSDLCWSDCHKILDVGHLWAKSWIWACNLNVAKELQFKTKKTQISEG